MELTKQYAEWILGRNPNWSAFMVDYQGWSVMIQKEEPKYEPYKYKVFGYRWIDGVFYGEINRRYTSLEKALLHLVNRFNENADEKDEYKTFKEWLEKPVSLEDSFITI